MLSLNLPVAKASLSAFVLCAGSRFHASLGIFSRWTNQTQGAWVCSHDGPIRRRARGYVLTTDQSDAGSV
eukprot:7944391-Pyramimonas_sp.AAC.1